MASTLRAVLRGLEHKRCCFAEALNQHQAWATWTGGSGETIASISSPRLDLPSDSETFGGFKMQSSLLRFFQQKSVNFSGFHTLRITMAVGPS